MSDVAFSELESQVESLPLNQIVILKEKIDAMLTRSQNARDHEKEFVFDSLVRHTDRADRADEYIRELRDNDRF